MYIYIYVYITLILTSAHTWQYEGKFGSSSIPPEYSKPAFIATRKAMLIASGLPLSGRYVSICTFVPVKHQ